MKKRLYLFGISIILILLSIFNWNEEMNETDYAELIKVVVREIGNQTLLANEDSISLVSPVLKLKKDLYQLSFQNEVRIEPEVIPEIIKKTFKQGNIREEYRLEILQCDGGEVAYSYQIGGQILESIIPCRGRVLPKACYQMQIRFFAGLKESVSSQAILLLIIGIILMGLALILKSKSASVDNQSTIQNDQKFTAIGSFQFYPDQNKLIKLPTEISLSRKECELLEILADNANQIVKRDELTKRVWEDHGVIVGRSLDTYISKLRKKLKDDESIKITNVHGVGYKLEVAKKEIQEPI